MDRIKRALLSRSVVICLILASLLAIALAASIPQSFLASPEKMLAWQSDHPLLARWSELLGLHHVYTHPAFALVLAGVTISLLLSARNQIVASWQRTFSADPVQGDAESFIVRRTPEESVHILASNGYVRVGVSAAGSLRMVRHPWGYWGNALLHLGMAVTIIASLFIALTRQQGVIQLAEGAIQHPGHPLLKEEHGLLAKPLVLPYALELDRISYRFRPDHSLQQVASTITFLSDDGKRETDTVEINRILFHKGIRLYQGGELGHAFFVGVSDPTGGERIFHLQIRHPEAPDKPSYNDFENLLGDGSVVRAKYFVDAAGKSFYRVNPLLILRVDSRGRELGRLPLQVGGDGAIGPYRFRLIGFAPWSRLIMVNITGMPVIFFGFFIICLGGVLHYFTPPREAVVRRTAGGGSEVGWHAPRFAGLYRDELTILKKALEGGDEDG